MKFIDFAKNKKTYAVVLVGLGCGIYQWYTGHDLPSYVDWGLGFLGLASLRHSVQTQTQTAAEAAAKLVSTVLDQITIPDTVIVPAPTQTVLTKGDVIVIGQPSPKTVSEHDVTEALNGAQLK